jgi:hypothetical protein
MHKRAVRPEVSQFEFSALWDAEDGKTVASLVDRVDQGRDENPLGLNVD